MMDARNTRESMTSERRPALKSSSDTACVRCRHQKVDATSTLRILYFSYLQATNICGMSQIRCSREMPSCERCRQRETSCRYPHPPDRKFIARHRARPNSDRLEAVLPREDRDEVSDNAARPSEIGARQIEQAKSNAVSHIVFVDLVSTCHGQFVRPLLLPQNIYIKCPRSS